MRTINNVRKSGYLKNVRETSSFIHFYGNFCDLCCKNFLHMQFIPFFREVTQLDIAKSGKNRAFISSQFFTLFKKPKGTYRNIGLMKYFYQKMITGRGIIFLSGRLSMPAVAGEMRLIGLMRIWG